MLNNNHTTEYLFDSDPNDLDRTYDLILSSKITVARYAAKNMVTRTKNKGSLNTISMAKRYRISVQAKTKSTMKRRGNEMEDI